MTKDTILATFYRALYDRVHCPLCGGRGVRWVTDEDGNVDACPCDCDVRAREVIEMLVGQTDENL
jgi:hypothetical protein